MLCCLYVIPFLEVMVLRTVSSISITGILLEMQILQAHLISAESVFLGVGPSLCISKPSKSCWGPSKSENHCLEVGQIVNAAQQCWHPGEPVIH